MRLDQLFKTGGGLKKRLASNDRLNSHQKLGEGFLCAKVRIWE
jgi:hypothetical protein